MLAAIRKRIRGDVDDPHKQRALEVELKAPASPVGVNHAGVIKQPVQCYPRYRAPSLRPNPKNRRAAAVSWEDGVASR